MGNVLYKDGRYECRRFHRECLYSVIEDVVLIVFGVEKQEGESSGGGIWGFGAVDHHLEVL